MLTKFWSTLFDDNEWVNIVKDVKGTHVTPISWLKENRYERATNPDNFFCINPLTQFGRKDSNVTCFRNILIEFDDLPLKTQNDFATNGIMPYSTCVFSGGKSFHFIISLQVPCKDIKEYKELVSRIHNKVPQADKSTRNPSRLSRTPGAIRDNGEEQSIIQVRHRVHRDELENWLGPDLKTEESNAIVKAPMGSGKKRLLPARVLAFIEYGAEEGGRNHALFINACELFRAGYDFEEVEAIARKVLNLPTFEIRQCVNSARRAVERDE